MRILGRPEFAKWCSERGFDSSGREWPFYRSAERYSFLIKLPTSPYKAVALARTCFPFNDQRTFRGAVVWFREWGIWNEMDEDTGMRIVQRLRDAFGVSLPLMDAPGHIFTGDEFADARAFWTLPLIFGWDAILFPVEADYFVFNSHDEVTAFVSRTRETHSRLLQDFKDWGPLEDGWYFH
jgi:hypothetical protein